MVDVLADKAHIRTHRTLMLARNATRPRFFLIPPSAGDKPEATSEMFI